jgi:predicted amidohydrolase
VLVIAVAQPACLPYDVEANISAHAEAVLAAGARVVVFPELSLTGYELDAPPVDPADSRLGPLIGACADAGSVALVGAPVLGADGRSHIAMLAVDGSGVTVVYRKLWLGTSETSRFSPGDEPAVLDVDGWRLGLAICKDTGTAQHSRDTAALGIDAYVAGTLMFPSERDEQDARARRIATQHDVVVAFASFAGSTGDGYTSSAGHSGIWARDGEVLAQAGSQPDDVVRATLR